MVNVGRRQAIEMNNDATIPTQQNAHHHGLFYSPVAINFPDLACQAVQ
jgi:hypothetical protein